MSVAKAANGSTYRARLLVTAVLMKSTMHPETPGKEVLLDFMNIDTTPWHVKPLRFEKKAVASFIVTVFYDKPFGYGSQLPSLRRKGLF